MSTQQVLFDAPGPRTIVRYRLYAVLGTLLVLGVLAAIGWRLWQREQLQAQQWSPFLEWGTWEQYLLPGVWDTLRAAGISIVIAMVLGLVLAMGRMSALAPLRWVTTVFVEFFRAVPVLIMMIFTFYYLSNQQYFPDRLNPLIAVITGLVLYNSSVVCEIVRSGVGSLPSGQREAGLSIGLSPAQVRRSILVPQALTSMLPVIVSQLIVILKDTALGYIILYPELLTQARRLGSADANVLQSYLVVAAVFITINYTLSKVAEAVEGRQRRTGRGAATTDGPTPSDDDGLAGQTQATAEADQVVHRG